MPQKLNEQSLNDLRGKCVTSAEFTEAERVSVTFEDGTELSFDVARAKLQPSQVASLADNGARPSKRQLEYLAFIANYMERYRRAPAEADIQSHFMVSAPSVNQMMQTLERRGFITREKGVPRSIKLCVNLPLMRIGSKMR